LQNVAAIIADPSKTAALGLNPTTTGILLDIHQQLVKIAAGLDFWGDWHSTVPIWTFDYLQSQAINFAQLAINAERDMIAYWERADAAQLTRTQLSTGVAQARADTQAAKMQAAATAAEAQAYADGLALAKVRAANATANANEYASTSAQAIVHQALSTQLSGGDDGDASQLNAYANRLTSGPYSLSGSRAPLSAAESLSAVRLNREYEVDSMKRQAQELALAATQAQAELNAANARTAAANAAVASAQCRADAAQQMLDTFNDANFTPEVWQRLGQAQSQLYQRYLTMATKIAKLMQQAYNFETDQSLALIHSDYSTGITDGLLGGEALLADIQTFTYELITTQTSKPQPIRQTISLANNYPFLFETQFRKTGTMAFDTRIDDFDSLYPGSYAGRITAVEVAVDGIVPASGISGTLENSGISAYRLPSAAIPPGNSGLKFRVQPKETLVLSDYAVRNDALEVPDDSRMMKIFQGAGVVSSWTLSLPKGINDVDYGALTDVRITFYYKARFDPTLRDTVLAQLAARPGFASRQRGIPLRWLYPDAFFQFQNTGRLALSPAASDFPYNQRTLVLTDIGVQVQTDGSVSAAGLKVALATPAHGATATATLDANGQFSSAGGNVWAPLAAGTAIGDYALAMTAADNPAMVKNSALVLAPIINIGLIIGTASPRAPELERAMAKTSGTDPQALTLPNGGGAVQGLGATFETDLNTGTGSYSIPIDLPPGPNGIMPTVTLRYSSSAGNGPFGMGWSLGAVTIARKNDDRIPDYGPNDNSFVLVGVEDLIPLGGGAYRPRVDTMNWRMLKSGAGWQLTDTRGLRHSLGATAESRVETVEGGLTKTALWLLDTMTDTNGNTVRYSYRQDGAQRYLDHIDWGTCSLRFLYEERPDVISTGRYGIWLATALRCSRIELHVPGLAPSLTRSWTLDYTAAPGSGHSLLSRVTLRGHAADGSTVTSPPLTLVYSAAQSPQLSRFAGAAEGFGPARFETGQTELLDWDGDGLPDAIELDQGRIRVWPNRGRGRWGTPHLYEQVPALVSFDEPGIAFADMLGNGTADLIVSDRPLSGFYPHTPGGGFERLISWRELPAHSLSDGNARLVDFDGDGIIDLLVTGPDFFSLYYRDPAGGWRPVPQTIPRAKAPPVSFSDPHVALADMNGDGLQDLVRIDGGGVTWWHYLGGGRWLDAVRMTNAPELPCQHDPRRMQLADVNGDGCADLIYVGPQSVTVWLNQGGQRLAGPIEIPFTPFALPGQFRLADMNGSGGVGIVFSSVAEGLRRANYLYLDLTGGRKPYLLTGINTGLGGRIDIYYRPSTEFAVDAAEAGAPWRTFHPFPVQCVGEVRATDLVTGVVATTQNRYHEARYDGTTRRFLGFAVVDVDTVGDATIPTLRTRNVYHLGLDPADPNRKLSPDEALWLSALRRRLLRTEMYGIDGSADEAKPYQVVTHEYDVTVLPGADGQSVLVPFERRTFEEQWDRGAAPFAARDQVPRS
jgi:hypothetical protein